MRMTHQEMRSSLPAASEKELAELDRILTQTEKIDSLRRAQQHLGSVHAAMKRAGIPEDRIRRKLEPLQARMRRMGGSVSHILDQMLDRARNEHRLSALMRLVGTHVARQGRKAPAMPIVGMRGRGSWTGGDAIFHM